MLCFRVGMNGSNLHVCNNKFVDVFACRFLLCSTRVFCDLAPEKLLLCLRATNAADRPLIDYSRFMILVARLESRGIR